MWGWRGRVITGGRKAQRSQTAVVKVATRSREERKLIDEVKEEHPMYRHRKIQGVLQQRGVYLSASAIYEHLKATG